MDTPEPFYVGAPEPRSGFGRSLPHGPLERSPGGLFVVALGAADDAGVAGDDQGGGAPAEDLQAPAGRGDPLAGSGGVGPVDQPRTVHPSPTGRRTGIRSGEPSKTSTGCIAGDRVADHLDVLDWTGIDVPRVV